MLYQILIFSVIIVSVFAGLACAVVRFTLTGKVPSKVESRTSLTKCNRALSQCGQKPLTPAETATAKKTAVASTTKHSLA
ncbi:hypothetical protein SAMN02910358_02297 [Lachnospiraceae bacterium XBB1006]|nr:hypothetical protein SAMN02910358_02297 [Lachnospiraceae bacterium XBB1006]